MVAPRAVMTAVESVAFESGGHHRVGPGHGRIGRMTFFNSSLLKLSIAFEACNGRLKTSGLDVVTAVVTVVVNSPGPHYTSVRGV
ncbi:hypothetical protein EVAR_50832_1 [Eumeta japonica]|uniref:Uncharacterized protein n=1 Tax=Eumeta variegata TaxID=151549 RepID=A0A4C1XE16_EUMVA|nr:hypothetical protein EVAR_50832_1 [Eumeta japonica]